jgi:hypothetical protein
MTQYRNILNTFIGDDQEMDVSITTLSVQVPILPKVTNIGLQIAHSFYIFVTFSQYILKG